MNKISLDEKFALFTEHWRPKTIAALNGQEIKLVKVQGEFPWHYHEREDAFLHGLARPVSRVEFKDRVVSLKPGEVVVPRGVEHRTLCRPRGVDFMLRASRHGQYRQSAGPDVHGPERSGDLSWRTLSALSHSS
jgi:hypothetical protein